MMRIFTPIKLALGLAFSVAAGTPVFAEILPAPLPPQIALAVDGMHAQGEDIIVVLDKNNAELSIIDHGTIVMKSPALYGRGEGEDENIDKRTTPAGVFALREYAINPKEYKGGLGLAFLCKDTCYMIHPTWLGDPSERRNERLASPTPDDNAISRIGCINISDDFFKNAHRYLIGHEKLRTLPDGRRVWSMPRLVVLPKTQDLAVTAQYLGVSSP